MLLSELQAGAGRPELSAYVKPGRQLPELRAGGLEVRLAETEGEIDAAQRLRYEIFIGEMGATPSDAMRKEGRDWGGFDPYCDHLLVLDHTEGKAKVVGTYRLLRRSALPEGMQFYTEGEFDISALKRLDGEILELGRSCVDAQHRSRAVMQLLWRGIGAYVEAHDVKVMFGCGSLHGTRPDDHAQTLSYLHHYHLAPETLRMKALPERFTPMDLMEKDALNAKRAFAGLPALIKGYLRLGGFVGAGAVIDHEYNTIDVGIVVETGRVSDRYVERYAGENTKESINASRRESNA